MKEEKKKEIKFVKLEFISNGLKYEISDNFTCGLDAAKNTLKQRATTKFGEITIIKFTAEW